jgi:hypothetical protein
VRALVFSLVVAATGCGRILGLDDPIGRDGTSGDCFGPAGWQVCLAATPQGPLTLPSQINTDTSSACADPAAASFDGQPSACIVVATSIDVPVTTTAVGSRPLVVLATGMLTIEGMLDVSSHSGMPAGAGATSSGCAAAATQAERDSNGGGGGAGGSFATVGGGGGAGNSASAAGGAPAPVVTAPTQLTGGCRGQVGGEGSNNAKGTPGEAGGAVYVVAGVSLVIHGVVDASGAGGAGGATAAGGGGGGAGGMIVLSAPSISAAGASLLANGGGGASGATSSTGTAGADPDPSMPTVSAIGGMPPTGAGGGGGGFASAGAAAAGGAGNNDAGGGGGGGGGGFVLADHVVTGVIASPAIGIL